MPKGAIHQTQINSRRRPAVAGMLITLALNTETELLINSDPQAAEVYTVTVDTATDGEDYGIDLSDPLDVSATFTATSGVAADIAEGLASAWNAAPQARGFAAAEAAGAVVTLTGVYPGVAFTAAAGDNAGKMTVANTVEAAEAVAVPFGRAMVSTSFSAGEPDQLGVLAASSALDSRVSTLTVVYAAGEVYTVSLTVEGRTYSVSVDADTNDADTATAIAAAIEAMMPANSVAAVAASDVVTLTAELAGKFFEVDLGLKSGTTARLVLADTTNTPACDFNAAFAGVSLYTYDEAQLDTSTESAEYAANSGVEVVREGSVWVASTEAVQHRGKVYVELDGTGDDAGKFYTTSSSTRVLVDPDYCRWMRSDDASSDANVSALRVKLPA